MKLITLLLLIFSLEVLSIEKDSVEFLQWYIQKKDLYVSSKKYIKRLEKKLESNEIMGLELIIADATDSQIASKFGHALFRFVDTDNDPGNDITISFVADVNGPKASNISGVVGKYGVYPEVKSLRLFVKQYIKQQSRPLKRYLIPSDRDMHLALVETLMSWWDEIHQARKDVYNESVKEAKKEAEKKGKELYGEGQYELLDIKFYDEEFKEELIQSYGILKKETYTFENDQDRDKALYSQAYNRALESLDIKKNEIVINLYQELWKIQKTKETLKIENSDIEKATEIAQEHFKNKEFKLFKILTPLLEVDGYYALSKENISNIQVLQKALIKIEVKNLVVKNVISEGLGKYTFFSNNCAGAVIKFLKKSNFPHKRTVGIQGRIPVKLNKWLSRSLLSPYPPVSIEGAKKLRSKITRILGFNSKEFQDYRFPEHQWKIISNYISDSEKFLFYDLYNTKVTSEYSTLVRNEISKLKAPDYNTIYEIQTENQIFYKLCEDSKCTKKLKNRLNAKWSKKEILKVKRQVHRTGNNTFIHEGLTKNLKILNHLKLLDYIPQDFK